MRHVILLNLIPKTFALSLIFLLIIHISSAQMMSSSNYRIESDSLNIGGGYSTSSNYVLESTVGEIATGIGTSTNYSLRAGYQQMQEVYISMSGFANVAMSPSLPGITGGTSTGVTAVNVVTDSSAGYQLSISASGAPAMRSGINTIADYVPVAGSVPDFIFTSASSDAHFGFSPEGGDVVTRFQDSVGTCGVAGGDTIDRCWDGLSTSSVVIASGVTANHPLGATTTIKFQVGIGGGIVVAPGLYEATTTITALSL
jgi:hypothetical protein